ncbi:MAG TPA: hypothetical protein VJT31_01430 [Rugosimonospora sp.]|nr:hypothetical protein [Rugosimonospora sp.]
MRYAPVSHPRRLIGAALVLALPVLGLGTAGTPIRVCWDRTANSTC